VQRFIHDQQLLAHRKRLCIVGSDKDEHLVDRIKNIPPEKVKHEVVENRGHERKGFLGGVACDTVCNHATEDPHVDNVPDFDRCEWPVVKIRREGGKEGDVDGGKNASKISNANGGQPQLRDHSLRGPAPQPSFSATHKAVLVIDEQRAAVRGRPHNAGRVVEGRHACGDGDASHRRGTGDAAPPAAG
jgi:hypothetical protein